MTHRFATLALVLGAVLVTAAGVALWVGASDLMLIQAGPKRHVAAEQLATSARGWFGVDACIRHDLAVVVTGEGTAYKLGEQGIVHDDGDRIYTPISAVADCAEDRPPTKVYALVEDADSLGTTFQNPAPSRIAPPPIVARVDGTIGPRVGDSSRAKKAARKLLPEVPSIETAPLLKKDGRPGERWVALMTMAAGLHGFVFLALGIRYLRRRQRRVEALRTGDLDDAEEVFFQTETLD